MRQADDIDELVPGWERDGLSPSLVAIIELSKRTSRLHQLFERGTRAELADLGLTYAEFDVLAALRRAGAPYRLKPSELSRALLLTSGGTSNVLQRLTKAGHVAREANTGDARSRYVHLTPQGLAQAEKALAAVGRVHEEAMTGIPPESIRQAADALREITAPLSHRRYQ
ncbi:MarR family winged helix-turn-helix transcriptional regulator [Spirillospora sp. CA-294931]|uniref:MarR family winged helix-turn-helix transcriptional regulator n=1 Tax=Spirillospora sp. CA-294931 TaxID=3240042 RepID=UPI003D8E5EC2